MNPLSLLTSVGSSLTGGFWLYVAAFAVGAGAGGVVTHKVDANHYGMQIAEGRVQLQTEKAAHSADLAAISNKAAEAASAALLTEQNMQHHLAALDAQHTQEIQNAKTETDKLRRDVANGAVRLRIAIARASAASGNGVPAASGAASVGDGSTAELAPDARQAYFDLRDALNRTQQQIEGAQDYIRNVCQPAQ